MKKTIIFILLLFLFRPSEAQWNFFHHRYNDFTSSYPQSGLMGSGFTVRYGNQAGSNFLCGFNYEREAALLYLTKSAVDGKVYSIPGYFNHIYSISADPDINATARVISMRASEKTSTGDFLVAGSYVTPDPGYPSINGTGIFLMKLDWKGTLLSTWGYSLPGNPQLKVTQVLPSTVSNNIFICGYTFTQDLYNSDPFFISSFVLCIDGSSGAVVWGGLYDVSPSGTDKALGIAQIPDPINLNPGPPPVPGGPPPTPVWDYELFLVGKYLSGNSMGYILRINSLTGAPKGNAQLYGDPSGNQYFTAIKTSTNDAVSLANNKFIISGIFGAQEPLPSNAKFWFLATDRDNILAGILGTPAWSYTYTLPTGFQILYGPYPLYDQNIPENGNIYERPILCCTFYNGQTPHEYYLSGYVYNGLDLDLSVIKTDNFGIARESNNYGGGSSYWPNGVNSFYTYGDWSEDAGRDADIYDPDPLANYASLRVFGANILHNWGGYEMFSAYPNGVTYCNYAIHDIDNLSGPGWYTEVTSTATSSFSMVNVNAVRQYSGDDNEVCRTTYPINGGVWTLIGQNDNNVTLGPNPLNANQPSELAIKMETSEAPAEIFIKVSDMLGRVCFSGTVKADAKGIYRVPLEAMKPGTYLVQVHKEASIYNKILLVR